MMMRRSGLVTDARKAWVSALVARSAPPALARSGTPPLLMLTGVECHCAASRTGASSMVVTLPCTRNGATSAPTADALTRHIIKPDRHQRLNRDPDLMELKFKCCPCL